MSDPAPSPGPDEELERPESDIVRSSDPEDPGDPRRSTARGRRASGRIALGFVVGPLVGALVGLTLGAIFGGVGSTAMWGAVVAGAVFGALGGFWGGLSSLGPPEEGNDPLPRASRDDGDERQGPGGSSVIG